MKEFKRVVGWVAVGALGVFLGVVMGWTYIDRYMVQDCGLQPVSACMVSFDVQPVSDSIMQSKGLEGAENGLSVGDNYGSQVTAPEHVLEPKVSGAFLQYGHSDVQTHNPQLAGQNR